MWDIHQALLHPSSNAKQKLDYPPLAPYGINIFLIDEMEVQNQITSFISDNLFFSNVVFDFINHNPTYFETTLQ
tara:strand:- start:14 stop:235 length:222 start_codon:yes stop_codon:yes gene_type:complete